MDIRKLQRAIVDGLEDVKAQHISVFNTEHLTSMFERVIIASGTSNRQTKALAASVRESVKAQGLPVLSTEGEDNGEWIIVDCGAAVAHIMQPAIRDYYHLEEIWGGKTVRMKVAAADGRLVKASEPEPASRKSAAKTATQTSSKPSFKTPAKTSSNFAAKTAASRAPAKKVVAKKAANQAAAFKRVAARPPARKAPAAKKAAVRKTAARAPRAAKA